MKSALENGWMFLLYCYYLAIIVFIAVKASFQGKTFLAQSSKPTSIALWCFWLCTARSSNFEACLLIIIMKRNVHK